MYESLLSLRLTSSNTATLMKAILEMAIVTYMIKTHTKPVFSTIHTISIINLIKLLKNQEQNRGQNYCKAEYPHKNL